MINFIDLFFGFIIYIRLITEAFQVIFLASFSEIHTWNESSASRIISLVIAVLIFLMTLLFFTFSFWMVFKPTQADGESEGNSTAKYRRFQEFFDGIKNNSKARMYPIISIFLRRLIYIPLLIALSSTLQKLLIILVCELLIQIFFIRVRPFKETKDNLLEGANLAFFMVITGLLIYLKEHQSWVKTWETIYLYIILSNNIIAAMIIFGTTPI